MSRPSSRFLNCLPGWAFFLVSIGSCGQLVAAETNLQWKSTGPHKVAALTVEPNGQDGFQNLTAEETGITFANKLTDRQVAQNRIRENGSGVALGDINGDGWTDIYFCRLDGSNALYRNDGNWRFTDITQGSGVERANRFSTGAALADIDGDGDLDLLATSVGGGVQIYHNNGSGQFTPDQKSQLLPQMGATSLAIADINNDGDLDFYVANYRTTTIRDGNDPVEAEIKRVNGQIVVTPADRYKAQSLPNGEFTIVERGEPDILYINRGSGVFAPVPWNSGAFLATNRAPLREAPRRWGLSALFHDLNDDQHPELYVCNDFSFSEDLAYFSRGGRQFQAYSPYSFRNMSLSAMAADAADIDRDGDQDLFVVEMLSRSHALRQRQRANALTLRKMRPPIENPAHAPEILRNTLFVNRNDHSFAEIAQLSGLAASEWSWGIAFIDVDLDGWEDCLITNGNFHDVIDADASKRLEKLGEGTTSEDDLKNLKLFPRLETDNLAFRNLGNLRFVESGEAWGFNTKGISHGMALGDLDNDGDLDVVVNHLNQPAGIYRNTSPAPRVAVRLRGMGQNPFGVGAKIELLSDAPPQSQTMLSGGRYLSSDDPIQCFAANELTNAKLMVTWRNGTRTIIDSLVPNHLYEIHQTTDALPPKAKDPTSPTPIFNLSRITIPPRHRDQPFDELTRQPLLTHQMSRLGPGLAWFDINGDGWDDLIQGSGRGGRLSVHINQQGEKFSELADAPITQSISRDLTSIIGWNPHEDQTNLLVGASNYEDGSTRGGAVLDYDLSAKKRSNAVEANHSATGPIALADIDGDGDLDLFVGGRVVPGQFPQPAGSRLFLNRDGKWNLDETNVALLSQIGLVTSAVFADLNEDNDPDLILATHWGPIRILENHDGRFEDTTAAWGLKEETGWWNGITTGDFNNDGRVDLAASNWGQNTRYEGYRERPLTLHYGDFKRNGQTLGVEVYYDPFTQQNKAWADLDQLAIALPEVRRRFPTYRAFSEASAESILAPYRSQIKQLECRRFESTVFLNTGDQFTPKTLPKEAQWSPAFGIAAADFDGDGNHDLALAQNFFHVEPTLSRYDAGRGLLLLGDGKGGFRVLTGKESGIRFYGEQRGLALADFNQDNRIDLALTENHGPIHLLENISGAQGIRVKLVGPAANPNAIGATIRLGDEERWGPVTVIKSNNGYWSQDSHSAVLFGPSHNSLWVRWPDGKESTHTISPGEDRIVATAR